MDSYTSWTRRPYGWLRTPSRKREAHLEGAIERMVKVSFSWEEVKINLKVFDLGRLRCSLLRVLPTRRCLMHDGACCFEYSLGEGFFFRLVDGRFTAPHLCDDTLFSVLLPKRASLLVDKPYHNSHSSDIFVVFLLQRSIETLTHCFLFPRCQRVYSMTWLIPPHILKP